MFLFLFSEQRRAGRTGRVRPGVVYRVYSKNLYGKFDDHEDSEVLRYVQFSHYTFLGTFFIVYIFLFCSSSLWFHHSLLSTSPLFVSLSPSLLHFLDHYHITFLAVLFKR